MPVYFFFLDCIVLTKSLKQGFVEEQFYFFESAQFFVLAKHRSLVTHLLHDLLFLYCIALFIIKTYFSNTFVKKREKEEEKGMQDLMNKKNIIMLEQQPRQLQA